MSQSDAKALFTDIAVFSFQVPVSQLTTLYLPAGRLAQQQEGITTEPVSGVWGDLDGYLSIITTTTSTADLRAIIEQSPPTT